jgi:hypothetical protein
VLRALGRALALDEASAARLRELGRPAAARSRRRPLAPERAPPTITRLLDALPPRPAYVQGRYMDVLAANALMTALSPMYEPGASIVRAAFLDGRVAELSADPDERLANAVSGLRALAGPDVDDPRLAELAGELSVKGEQFRRLWSRHDVRPQAGGGTHRLRHPVAGDLELAYDEFYPAGADRQPLVVYQAEAGSRAEEALAFLAAAVTA